MPYCDFDVVLLGDFRYLGGTGTGIAEEIRIQASAGFSTGLLQLSSPTIGPERRLNRQIARTVDLGLAEPLVPSQPVSARLLILHHPFPFEHRPLVSLPVEAERVVLVVHHPLRNASGAFEFDLEAVLANIRLLVGDRVQLAPVSPVVRRQLLEFRADLPLTRFDWLQVIDGRSWRSERRRGQLEQLVIGRHSRADDQKWPDSREEVIRCYPAQPDVEVRILGAGPFLHEKYSPIPFNWVLFPFDDISPPEFLRGLDAYVYFHSSRWLEAFGRNILEALAAGLPTIIPETSRELFEEGAIVASPEELPEIIQRLRVDSQYRALAGQNASFFSQARYGPSLHVERIRELTEEVRSHPRPVGRRQESVLFVTDNGLGLGHVTRTLAVARQLSKFAAAFFTMSPAAAVIAEQGYPVEFMAFHSYRGCDPIAWNKAFCEELVALVRFYGVRVVAFDGTGVFPGLCDALEALPDVASAWIRRAMWQQTQALSSLANERCFDLIIEPDDLASPWDTGPTVARRPSVLRVPPVRIADDAALLSRSDARDRLGIDREASAVLLQLGSGNLRANANLVDRCVRSAVKAGATVCVAEWPIALASTVPPGCIRIREYPLFPVLSAFDAAIAAPGYNTFHENIAAALPTLFVPTRHAVLDNQSCRASFAAAAGLGLCASEQTAGELEDAVSRLLEPGTRARIQQACKSEPVTNGARSVAEALERLAFVGPAPLR